MKDTIEAETVKPKGSELLGNALGHIFGGGEFGFLDPNATGSTNPQAKNSRQFDEQSSKPKGRTLRSFDQLRQPSAPGQLKAKPESKVVGKPAKPDSWYKVGMTDSLYRLYSGYFNEPVYLPECFALAAIEQLAKLEKDDRVEVKLIERSKSPRLQVVALRLDDNTWTADDAEADAKAFRAQHSKKSAKSGAAPTGTVKWFNPEKGFGFIVRDGGHPDIFLHISEVEKICVDNVKEGARLQFSVGSGRNGRDCAVNLKLID